VTIIVMVGLFLTFMGIGMPIGHCMGLAAILALGYEGQIPLLLLPQRFYDALDSFALLAVPLFILAGELMNVGGITERIVAFSRAFLGHIRGGLAQANILTNMFMSAISGSAAADVAAVGSMMIPAMKREGYRPEFAVAVTACAALMGPIIPPSIIAVIYGSITNVSIGALLLAGVFPGILAGLCMMVLVRLLAHRSGAKLLAAASWHEAGIATLRVLPAALMPIMIIGGILFGAFTPTEAGAVAVVYGLLFGLAGQRFGAARLYDMFRNAAYVTSSALITLGGAALFAWVLTRGGVAQWALQALVAITTDRDLSLLIILGFLFLLGIFIEPVPALIMVVPILQPITVHIGLDQVHVGIVTLMMLVLGSVTPPVGIIAMIACKIAGIEYSRTFSILTPFILVWCAVILLVAFVPAIALWLPAQLQAGG
jgi:C4-dicarboxylate transporter, DctM subunit